VKLIVTAPLARYCGAMIVMMIVVTGAVRAEPVFSFDATPGKLPKTVVPISYSIELRPDAESLALPGVEVIDIEVREPTARLMPRPRPRPSLLHSSSQRARIGCASRRGSTSSIAVSSSWIIRPTAAALQRYISAKLRPVLDRLGWDACEALPCTGIPDSHSSPDFPA